jgi:allantoicase
MLKEVPDSDISADAPFWNEILPPQKLGPDRVHVFEEELPGASAVSHVRFDIYPDGGISRLRLFGNPTGD